jgi:hypothetical protein
VSQIGEWNRFLYYYADGGTKTIGFVHDEERQQLFKLTLNGHINKNVTALYNYVLENAYQYAILSKETLRYMAIFKNAGVKVIINNLKEQGDI